MDSTVTVWLLDFPVKTSSRYFVPEDQFLWLDCDVKSSFVQIVQFEVREQSAL